MVLNRKTEYGSVRSAAAGGHTLPPRLTSVGLLLIFLAGVLCLCGALGYQHIAAPGPAVSLEDHAQPAPEDSPAEHAGDHGPTTIAYTATLLAASAGLALLLLAGPARRIRLRCTNIYVRRPPPKAAPLAVQGPARPQLQVFLL